MSNSRHVGYRSGRLAVELASVALAVTLAVTACSGSGGSSESPERTEGSTASTTAVQATDLDTEVPDLCTLFTAEDFQAVTGETAGEPESEAATGAVRGSCTISAESGFPLVMLAAYNESDRAATLDMVEAEKVDDLGREAYWDSSIGLVIPLEGKDWYLQVAATDGGFDLDASVAVAKVALDNLEG